jgi:hypothetical protein
MLGNLEEVALGGSLVVAICAVMALNNIKTPEIELAPAANAADKPAVLEVAETPVAQPISFTVTGKRLPKECKGVPATDEIDARCEALRDQTRVTVHSKSE